MSMMLHVDKWFVDGIGDMGYTIDDTLRFNQANDVAA